MKKSKHEIKNKDKNKKSNKILRIVVLIVLILLVIAGTTYIIYNFINNKKDTGTEMQKVLENIKITEPITPEKTEMMLKVIELQKQNSDIVGWLQIEGTNINYPVLQGEDNSYYMTHTYNKEYSRNGSIFLDKDYNWELPSANLLMYGHNNKNGTMFEELMNYKEESYYKEHTKIKFITNNEEAEYEIIAAFLSRVYYKNEKDVFRYYYFINAENEQQFNEYVQNSKKDSLYDTGITAQYGDQLLTLSTCSYHTEDGRFAVVAKKIKPEEKVNQ